jgi:hypothetical protein
MSISVTPSGASASSTALTIAAGARSGFAAAFRSQRVVRARLALIELGFDERQIAGARQRVIHERSGQQLAAAVIQAEFAQRLSQPLRNPAVDLSVHDHVIDDRADVVHAPIADHARLAG